MAYLFAFDWIHIMSWGKRGRNVLVGDLKSSLLLSSFKGSGELNLLI